jgi:hypothetical protein
VAIHVGDSTYFEEPDGRIIVAHKRGGRAEFAEVGPDGELGLVGAARYAE